MDSQLEKKTHLQSWRWNTRTRSKCTTSRQVEAAKTQQLLENSLRILITPHSLVCPWICCFIRKEMNMPVSQGSLNLHRIFTKVACCL
ncbi:hypothetical protein RLOC_00003888 [Lonchura striata]|uniref:Uncharacterized protein n=1 Tax=Lonchura striata TaxID=40157 RepID=A0A218UBN8_9PASE|nr:hypothetical protein RLOC_00003888 [Lonchura striata domestica]